MRDDSTGKFLKGSQIGIATQFKKGGVSWNKGTKGLMKTNSGSFKPEPIGTITTRKCNNGPGYEYQYIKTISGWKRYYPNGKTKKPSYMKDQSIALRKLFVTSKINHINDTIKKDHIAGVGKMIEKAPIVKKIKKKPLTAAEIKQKEFLAQFGIKGSTINIPIKR